MKQKLFKEDDKIRLKSNWKRILRNATYITNIDYLMRNRMFVTVAFSPLEEDEYIFLKEEKHFKHRYPIKIFKHFDYLDYI